MFFAPQSGLLQIIGLMIFTALIWTDREYCDLWIGLDMLQFKFKPFVNERLKFRQLASLLT
jgi:hypothetical protein